MMLTPDLSGLGIQPLEVPALDLTGKITKLDNHYSKAGGFSDVYKGIDSRGTKEVAVKAFRFKFSVTEHERTTTKMIRRELGIWRRLFHPNIVPFLGIVYDFEKRGSTSLVSEWMPNGTLEAFFAQYDDRLMLDHRLQLMLDIANGLLYLHSFPMVHGDLTCNNVLLDRNFNARLTDFGLTSIVGDIPDALQYLQMSTARPGALRWAAPEHFSVNPNGVTERTTKSDIYSFGNLALLTLSGKHPWSEVSLDIAVVLRLHQGDKPGRPQSRPIVDKHWELIERCWLPVHERPEVEDVVSTLESFLGSCLPAPPLRDYLCDTPDSTIEPLDRTPRRTSVSARDAVLVNIRRSSDIEHSRLGLDDSANLDVVGEQEQRRPTRDDSSSNTTTIRSSGLFTKELQSSTGFISEEFMRYIFTEVPHRLIDTSTMKFVERTALFEVFSKEVRRISEEDITRRMGSDTEGSVKMPYHTAIKEIIHEVVKYATLSHCWTIDEPSYRDIYTGIFRESSGFKKLTHFCETARSHGYTLAWSDTCCINESDRAEHTDAIKSASNWCANSHLCIVYLGETTSSSDLHCEKWFTRNWPLLELLVPRRMKFYDMYWQPLTNSTNDKDNKELMSAISAVTSIPTQVLVADNRKGVKGRGVWEIMSWASTRKTTRVEDAAYSLCGLFDITLPIAYGEGDRSFHNLVKALVERRCSWDVFAWVGVPSQYHPALPSSPGCYPKFDGDTVENVGMTDFSVTVHGLWLTSVPLVPLEFSSSEAISPGLFEVRLKPRGTGHFGEVSVVCGVLGPRHLRDAQDLHACILNYRPVGQGRGELRAGRMYVCFLLYSRSWHPGGGTWVKYTTENQLRVSYSGTEPEVDVAVFSLENVHIEALS